MSDEIDSRNFEVDMRPIVEALDALLDQSDAASLSPALVDRASHNLAIFIKAAAMDPKSPKCGWFYEQLGMQVTMFLGRQLASQKIAAKALSPFRSGKS